MGPCVLGQDPERTARSAGPGRFTATVTGCTSVSEGRRAPRCPTFITLDQEGGFECGVSEFPSSELQETADPVR